MKVKFTHKSGRVEEMDERYAKVLQGFKKGTYSTATGKGAYLTRDMRPQAAPAPEPAPAPSPAPFTAVEALEETLSEETDSQGVAWDPELHTQSRLKNMNGTWRKRSR